MTTNEMACQELVEVITEYLEGTLPEPDRQRFEEHLALCRGCRIYLDQMRQTASALGKLDADALTPENRQQLLQLFRNWKRT